MSVIASSFVRYQRYSGYADPRYPEGHWFAVVSGLGDASGGVLQLQAVLTPATQPARNTRMYSVEQVFLRRDTAADVTIDLLTENMARAVTGVNADHRVAVLLISNTAGTAASIRGDQLTFLPSFLGSQRILGTVASYSSIDSNVLGVTEVLSVQGYWWGARSVMVDGGPQRPPSGLYKA